MQWARAKGYQSCVLPHSSNPTRFSKIARKRLNFKGNNFVRQHLDANYLRAFAILKDVPPNLPMIICGKSIRPCEFFGDDFDLLWILAGSGSLLYSNSLTNCRNPSMPIVKKKSVFQKNADPGQVS